MHFLTLAETRSRCGGIVTLDERGWPRYPSAEQVYARAPFPGLTELTSYCQYLERSLRPREACLLWVTAWDIWGSQNWHLYYRLRQSYGELRTLGDAPGHLFLDYESADLVSFLEVGMLCGWDMHVIPIVGYNRALVSHDEFVEFVADDNNMVDEFASQLGGAEVRTNDRSS